MEALQGAAKVGGVFTVEHWRDGKLLGTEECPNLICNQGLNHILDVVLHGTTPVSPWYVALFKGNYTPVATVTASSVVADSTEAPATTDYDEATRQEYVEAAASSQSTTNSASKATFTMKTTITVYGAFLISSSSGSTGTLLAITRFSTSRAVIDNDVLTITYTLTAASA